MTTAQMRTIAELAVRWAKAREVTPITRESLMAAGVAREELLAAVKEMEETTDAPAESDAGRG
jgi:hypothetical protein